MPWSAPESEIEIALVLDVEFWLLLIENRERSKNSLYSQLNHTRRSRVEALPCRARQSVFARAQFIAERTGQHAGLRAV